MAAAQVVTWAMPWNSGMQVYSRSRGVRPKAWAVSRAMITPCRCGATTPLLLPVVPEVKLMAPMSWYSTRGNCGASLAPASSSAQDSTRSPGASMPGASSPR